MLPAMNTLRFSRVSNHPAILLACNGTKSTNVEKEKTNQKLLEK
jgi:hypothetical protein